MASTMAKLGLFAALAAAHNGAHQQFHARGAVETVVNVVTAIQYVTAGQPAPEAPATTAASTYAAPTSVHSFGPPAPSSKAPEEHAHTKPKAAAPAAKGVSGSPLGIAYNYESGDLSSYTGCSWAQDWDATPVEGTTLPDGVEFVPTVKVLGVENLVASAVTASKASHVLGYNEPDQSGISVASAIAGYTSGLVSLIDQGVGLGSPQTTSTDGVGLPWLTEFLDTCEATPACNVTFGNFHWYADPAVTDATELFDAFSGYVKQVTAALAKYNLPDGIWIPEFGFYNEVSTELKTEFLKLAQPFLDNPANGITRYAFFMAGSGPGGITSGGDDSALSQYLASG